MRKLTLGDMNAVLMLIALACPPGERLLDVSGKIPPNLRSLELLITVEPFYARIYIYEAGLPETFQPCCGNQSTSVIKVPIVSGRFCVRQSQPRMTWKIRGLLKSGFEL